MLPLELIALMPYLLLAVGGLLVLLVGTGSGSGSQSDFWPAATAVFFLFLSALGFVLPWGAHTILLNSLVFDPFSQRLGLLFVAGGLATVILAYRYTPRLDNKDETLYALVLFAVLGMCMLDSAANLLTAFLGLELLAVPLFGLIAWQPQRRGAVEGGIKYGVLAGVAAAFFAYGVALFYVDSGTLTLSQDLLPPGGVAPDAILLLSSSLLLVAVGFELAIVPFHMWAPDIYQAAPAPVTTLLGSVAKMAVLAFLIRLFGQQLPQVWNFFIPLLYALALASMIVGNLLALRQQNIKRLLAYSAIAHIGYILVAMTGGSEESIKAAIYYTIAYAVTSVTVFAVVTALALEGGDRESLQAWQGLGRRHPVYGLIMTLGLLSLAGLPPTVGFFAKLLAFTAALAAGHTVLVVVAVLTTAISFYYYLRVVVVMFKPGEAPAAQPVGWEIGITLAASAVLTLGLGVFAEPLLQLAAF